MTRIKILENICRKISAKQRAATGDKYLALDQLWNRAAILLYKSRVNAKKTAAEILIKGKIIGK